jgi:hypothetical protein
LNRPEPKDALSDDPTAVAIAANKITNTGILRLTIGSNVTSYTVTADEFLNGKDAAAALSG